jgi:uncharacterized protein
VIVPDTNLLLYAYSRHPLFGAAAARWWEGCLNGREAVGLTPTVVFGFIRIVTQPRGFSRPGQLADAAAVVRSWAAHPTVEMLEEGGAAHLERVLNLLADCGSAGNLTTDARIAAVALEHRAVVHTADADFSRFPGLAWHNPITGAGSRP